MLYKQICFLSSLVTGTKYAKRIPWAKDNFKRWQKAEEDGGRERERRICRNDSQSRRPLFVIKERQRVKLASKADAISNGTQERDGEKERTALGGRWLTGGSSSLTGQSVMWSAGNVGWATWCRLSTKALESQCSSVLSQPTAGSCCGNVYFMLFTSGVRWIHQDEAIGFSHPGAQEGVYMLCSH